MPELEKIDISNIDITIPEDIRRFNGAFFTPKVIVDYAHETISKTLGENWRDEYVVWDPAAGTLNLTRDYIFKELYSSTLFQEELDLANDLNPEGIKFQYDFLNDDFTAIRDGGKVPDGLYDAINDPKRKVMILMNPPYANTGTGQKSSVLGTAKINSKNIKSTNLKDEMSNLGFGRAAKDLYIKFIYGATKIINNSSCIFMFTKTGFLRNTSAINVRKYICSNFEYKKGFMFDSKYFEGASGGWPISFTGWEKGKTSSTILIDIIDKDINKNNISCIAVKEEIELIQVKKPYKSYINKLNERGTIKAKLTLSMPTTLKNIRKNFMLPKNFMGSMPCIGPINKYTGDRGIYTAAYSNKGTARLNITPKNIYDAIVFNSVRSLIKPTLVNEADDFMIPDFTNTKYEQFKYDSIILNLFENQSYQSSLRNVGYDKQGEPINYPTSTCKGTINVYNEWYFLSLQETADLADTYFPEIYQDAKGQKDRYVYTEIERIKSEYETSKQDILDKLALMAPNDPAGINIETQLAYKQLAELDENYFSPEALDVLEAGRKLYRDTFYMRATLHTQYPEYHLNTWDCGYWQLRTALKKAGMEHLMDDINAKYKILEDKMRPLVYELGFLKA